MCDIIMDDGQKLDLILLRLDQIDRRLTHVEESVKKMDDHVDFVDGIYESVKYPFHSLMEIVSFSNPKPIENKPPQELIELNK